MENFDVLLSSHPATHKRLLSFGFIFVILVGCQDEQKACSWKCRFFLLAHAWSTYLVFGPNTAILVSGTIVWTQAGLFAALFPHVSHVFTFSLLNCALRRWMFPYSKQWKVWCPTRNTDTHFKVCLVGAGQTSCCIVLPQTISLKPPNWATPPVTREWAQTLTN